MKALPVMCTALLLVACAGREPDPVATVNPTNSMMDCFAISSEIHANNRRAQELASEQGWKVAQNVAAGVAGVVIWPLWFGMDFQGAAKKEARALRSRQEYLSALAARKGCQSATTPR